MMTPEKSQLYYTYVYDDKIDAYVIYRIIKTVNRGEFKYIYGYIYGESQKDKAEELVNTLNQQNG